MQLAVDNGPHLAGTAASLSWHGAAVLNASLRGILVPVSRAAASSTAASAETTPTREVALTRIASAEIAAAAPPAATTTATARGKVRLTLFGRHLLKLGAKRRTLFVVPTAETAAAVGRVGLSIGRVSTAVGCVRATIGRVCASARCIATTVGGIDRATSTATTTVCG
jgi:hypothetical protein